MDGTWQTLDFTSGQPARDAARTLETVLGVAIVEQHYPQGGVVFISADPSVENFSVSGDAVQVFTHRADAVIDTLTSAGFTLTRRGPHAPAHVQEARGAVMYAVDGVVQTEFDLAEVDERTGADPSAPDPLLAELGVRDELSLPELQARCLALGERLSGSLVPPGWLRSPRYVFKIVDPLPDAIVPPAYLNPRAPFLDEPEIARILADPSPAMAPVVNRQIATAVIAGEREKTAPGGTLGPTSRDRRLSCCA
ncbi:hypothetical protein GT755_00190 [Herbidospora sp. NEAU-GS84]|uniref:Uncharacterized protein n=1 Tax=Herbidospora solisilvae TaxID=2696284 RepID=A0A7C9NDI0_9ACTN|nr:hypothetical protein [Herbidospora solisilvae]NAS20098.1 hypothetical protein [Herbidospora solisilvae]